MKRASRSLGTQGADALSKALKSEKKSFDLNATTQSSEHMPAENSFKFSRPPHTNYKPDLTLNNKSGLVKPFARQYAVLLKVNDRWVLTHPLVNPAASTSLSTIDQEQVPKMPEEVVQKVQDLEKDGYFYSGVNKDMIVFERIYNERKRGRTGAFKTTTTLLVSFVVLTGALFAAERVF